MRSKIAKQILEETPDEIRIFVRQYADIIVRINELLEKSGIRRTYHFYCALNDPGIPEIPGQSEH